MSAFIVVLLTVLLLPLGQRDPFSTYDVAVENVTISIPVLGVASPIKTFFLDGVSWAIPLWEAQVGHFQGTAWLDNAGNIVLGGHAEYPSGAPGIFHDLHTLKPGDVIVLTQADGQQRRYAVNDIRSVAYDDLSVVYPTVEEKLTLITCDEPTYDPARNDYSHRIVVIAQPLRVVTVPPLQYPLRHPILIP